VDEMKKLLIAIDAIGDRTSFSSNKLLSYDASATRKATLYSMQISNTSTDRVSLDSDAFVDVGGTVAVATSVVTANAVTLSASVAPNIEGRKVYTYDATNKLAYSGYVVGSVAADGKSVNLTASGTADASYTGGVVIAANKAIVFGDGKASVVLQSGISSLGAAISDANLTLDPSAAPETNPPLITAAWQSVQKSADAYVRSLTTQRGLMGAYQNQMEYTLSNLTELSSNLSSARSRVIDTDYANETAALTKGQILQQAATAMLAQANQMPNVILTLLK
jgi:flagellin